MAGPPPAGAPFGPWLAAAADNLLPARVQMAVSLGWHIVFACFGIAFPVLVGYAEWRARRRRDAELEDLARTWAKAMGVLFAVGAVSGTLLSFEMGILWPGLLARFGNVYGFPFVLEGFAFFLEAIFVGIYLFGWDRLPPRVHLLCVLPIALSGLAGAFFVVSANAWLNNPTGFRLDAAGRMVAADPVAAMFGPSTWPQFVHMYLGAFLVTGFATASVYATGMLRGRADRYHRLGLRIALTAGAVAAPVQIAVGDWIAGTVAVHQPAKLAAMEGLYRSGTGVPISVGGIYEDNRLRGALQVPYGLSLLVDRDPNGPVAGLDQVPPALRPPVNVVHLSYDLMVGLGMLLLAVAAWSAVGAWRRGRLPTDRWFRRAVALCGIAGPLALEAGWVTTEVGRQPFIVYRVMLTSDAVSPAPGLFLGCYAVVAGYAVLTVLTVWVLRRLARGHATRAPQEPPTPAPATGAPGASTGPAEGAP